MRAGSVTADEHATRATREKGLYAGDGALRPEIAEPPRWDPQLDVVTGDRNQDWLWGGRAVVATTRRSA